MRKILLITTAAAALAAALGAAEAPADNRGFIYGTVETRSGNTYEGILRWGTEESFWDDHFNSAKEDLPYMEDRSRRDRRRSRVRIFGVTIGYRWGGDWGSRQFISRFGDIREIEIHRGDDVTVTMKSGETYELEGGSNDIGARITVHDKSLGDLKLEWKKIERITFEPTPADVEPPARRLYGVLTTEDDDSFRGFIQWDIQECLWTDELDGETDDGDVSIQMGRIRAIEKRNRRGAWVELKDGRRMLLEGTNDVDSSTDGIFVEDERYGRVEVPWEAFDRLELEDTDRTGRGYDDYEPARRIAGTVRDVDGKSYSGDVAFDLDETETWELLQGDRNDVEYHIPFAMIRSVEPLGRDDSLVVLIDGTELELEDRQDVSEDNDGVVVISGRDETYLAWDEVAKIELETGPSRRTADRAKKVEEE